MVLFHSQRERLGRGGACSLELEKCRVAGAKSIQELLPSRGNNPLPAHLFQETSTLVLLKQN